MAYIRCAGDSGGSIQKKTATGAVATFNTGLPAPLIDVTSAIGYRSNGYTSASVINSKTTPVIDETPYHTRIAPSNIGNMALEKLVGVSCVFNQLQEMTSIDGSVAGITASITDGVFTISGTAGADGSLYIKPNANGGANIPANHVLLFTHTGNNNDFKWMRAGFPSWDNNYGFSKHNTDFYCSIKIEIENGRTYNASVKFNVIDLTAFFGSSTIADHLYNLEQATAGAGVAKFKALGFDAPYYPYTAGQLMSSAPVAKKITGKNLFGGEPEDLYRLKLPKGTTLTASSDALTEGTPFVRYFDENQVLIDYWGLSDVSGSRRKRTFTLQEDIFYIQFTTSGTSSETIENMQLEFGSTATTYEPYKEEMTIYSGEELRGIFELDANNNIVANGDEDDGSGTGAVRYGIVDLGSLSWSFESGWNAFKCEIPTAKRVSSGRANAISTIFLSVNGHYSGDSQPDMTMAINTSAHGEGVCTFRDNSFSGDKDAFKTAMNGVYLVYELATPTTQTISAWTNPIVAKEGGTETFVDTRTIALPTGHDTIYGTDLVVKTADFGTTVYGGSIDFTTGEVISNKNADGTDKTAETISITPVEVLSNAGTNNVFSDTNGNTTAQYIDKR